MALHENIKSQIKESMKAGDKVRLEVMRGLLTAFTNELVSTGKKPQDMLSDEEALKVMTRASKQRKDSIEQFIKGNRSDLASSEEAQLKIIEEFLPKLMSKDEIMAFAQNKIIEIGDINFSKKGIIMSVLMKDLKGKADGAMVKEVVDELLA